MIIADSLGEHICNGGQGAYPYLWYSLIRENAEDDFYAAGNHGQYIYVSPQTNPIIVRFGRSCGIDHFEWTSIFDDFAGQVMNH